MPGLTAGSGGGKAGGEPFGGPGGDGGDSSSDSILRQPIRSLSHSNCFRVLRLFTLCAFSKDTNKIIVEGSWITGNPGPIATSTRYLQSFMEKKGMIVTMQKKTNDFILF